MAVHPKISFLTSLLLLLLSSLTTLSPSASAVACHPSDLLALLQIKSHFNNASEFAAWDPTKADCCTWPDLSCDDTDRISGLTLSYSDELAGEIPAAIGDLPYLRSLRLYELPNLTGPIPRALTKLKRLANLILNSNGLSGTIPEFLGEMKSLELVDLMGNSFTGPIPASLAQLPNLFDLNLYRNKLTGSIPESFGSSIKTGMTLQMGENKLSGSIPKSLGQANLTTLDVSNNEFTGDVSFIFARDKSFDSIVLANNKFKFDFSNVDLPQGLKRLDIAYNQIYGSLPKQLGQLPLSFIDVSHNKLCGSIPPGRRLRRFNPSLFAHNKCLCGPPLSSCKKSK